MAHPRIAGIYKLTCKVNGKIYIGQSVDIFNRWRNHKNDSLRNEDCSLIARAIIKYGWNCFTKEILISFIDEDVEALNHYEELYIKKYHTFVGDPKCNGYNLTTGGGSGRRGQSTKDKISNANRGKKRTQNTKDKLRQAHLGKKSSPEHCKKISNALKGVIRSPEFGDKISRTKKGVKWTQKTREHQLQLRGEKSLYSAVVNLSTKQIFSIDSKVKLCGIDGRGLQRAIQKGTTYKGAIWRRLTIAEVDNYILLGVWSVDIMRKQRGIRQRSKTWEVTTV